MDRMKRHIEIITEALLAYRAILKCRSGFRERIKARQAEEALRDINGIMRDNVIITCPRKLPFVTLKNGKTYFIDDRLRELRNAADPLDSIAF